MASNNFLQMLLGGNYGGQLGVSPQYTNVKSGFVLDSEGRIAVDPVTGLNIPKKDRRRFKNFLENPQGVQAPLTLNQNVPRFSPAMGGNSALANIIGGAK